MKANAAPKRSGAPKLSIPSWVPTAVAMRAREIAQRNPPTVSLEVLRALTSDERMKWVWRELSKKHRDGNGYLYPVRAPGKRFEKDPNLQAAGMLLLFSAVIGICSKKSWGSGE